jgi:hypothetical protein
MREGTSSAATISRPHHRYWDGGGKLQIPAVGSYTFAFTVCSATILDVSTPAAEVTAFALCTVDRATLVHVRMRVSNIFKMSLT